MPAYFYVNGAPATPYLCHATPNSEDPTIVLRQATRGFSITQINCQGKAAAATSITGIGYRVKKWTTAGSGGTSITPAPRKFGTAVTAAVDKQTTITPGTTAGGIHAVFGCGAGSPGGWAAADADSAIYVDTGTADELSVNSVCGVASLPHDVGVEIAE